MARADGSYIHGKIVIILMLNLYGNPSSTFYYIEGLITYLDEIGANLNEAESCLIRVENPSGTIIVSIAIDDFLVTAKTPQAMD